MLGIKVFMKKVILILFLCSISFCKNFSMWKEIDSTDKKLATKYRETNKENKDQLLSVGYFYAKGLDRLNCKKGKNGLEKFFTEKNAFPMYCKTDAFGIINFSDYTALDALCHFEQEISKSNKISPLIDIKYKKHKYKFLSKLAFTTTPLTLSSGVIIKRMYFNDNFSFWSKAFSIGGLCILNTLSILHQDQLFKKMSNSKELHAIKLRRVAGVAKQWIKIVNDAEAEVEAESERKKLLATAERKILLANNNLSGILPGNTFMFDAKDFRKKVIPKENNDILKLVWPRGDTNAISMAASVYNIG